jgi:hypothetical protein
MMAILCDFHTFEAKKLAFFAKTNVMNKFLQNVAVFGKI